MLEKLDSSEERHITTVAGVKPALTALVFSAQAEVCNKQDNACGVWVLNILSGIIFQY